MTNLSELKADHPEMAWQAAGQLLEALFLLAGGWWVTAIESLISCHPAHAHEDHHCQLIVPEELEAAEEPGLFA